MVLINVFEDREKLEKAYLEAGGIRNLAKSLRVSVNTVRRYLREYKITDGDGNYIGDKPKPPTEISGEQMLKHLKTPMSVIDLANKFDCAPRKIEERITSLINDGYQIQQLGDKYKLETDIVPEEKHYQHPDEGLEFKFGVISDTHLGSKQQQLSYLQHYYEICKNEGVSTIYHCGDLIAGVDVYRGQHNDLFMHTYDDQVDYAIENYPYVEGITTHVISGNHDLATVKRMGADPIRQIAKARSDIKYLGQFSAWVELAPGFTAYLLHPQGGSAYALSYKLQKHIESFEGGNKPNMFFAGHWHSYCNTFVRNVHGFLVPCFESQTEFERRKALNPTIGGLIIKIKLNEDKSVQGVSFKQVFFLKPKEGDYCWNTKLITFPKVTNDLEYL